MATGDRTRQIYCTIKASDDGMTVAEVAAKCKLSKNVANSAITLMRGCGYLHKSGQRGIGKARSAVWKINGKAPPAFGSAKPTTAIPLELIKAMVGKPVTEIEKETGKHHSLAMLIRDVGLLLNMRLDGPDAEAVREAAALMGRGANTAARAVVKPVINRVWLGANASPKGRDHQIKKTRELFDKTVDVLTTIADGLGVKEVPFFSEPERAGYSLRLAEACKQISLFQHKVLKGGRP